MGLWGRLSKGGAPPSARAAFHRLHVFGKIPAQPDFVRLSLPQGDDPALVALEDWVTRSLEETSTELSLLWPSLLAAGAPIASLHRLPLEDGSPALVAAAYLPSADAVGRRFPLVACARLPDDAFAQTPHLLPIALSSFLRDAVPVLTAARELDVTELRRRVSAAQLSPLPSAPELVLPYELWARGTTIGRCALQLFGADVGELARALAVVHETLAPLRGGEPPRTPLALRFPVAIDPNYAAFWIDVVRRVGRWRSTVPTYLASGDDARGSLVVALGEAASPTLLADAWGASVAARTILGDVETAAANRGALSPAVRELLARTDVTLDKLAAALAG